MANLATASIALIDREDRQGNQRYLRFLLSDRLDGLVSLKQLQGAVNIAIKNILPVPQVREDLLGIINRQGKAVWILDLPSWLGEIPWCRRQKELPVGMVMLVEISGQTIGLLVEEFKQIETYQPQQLLPVTAAMFPEGWSALLSGYLLDSQERILVLLDIPGIIGALGLAFSEPESRDRSD